PPITITFFKNVLFRVVAETGLGHEYHFFGFQETDFFAEHSKVKRFDAAEQRIVGMNEEPQRPSTILINQAKQGRAFFVQLPGAIGLETKPLAHAECRFAAFEIFGRNTVAREDFFATIDATDSMV